MAAEPKLMPRTNLDMYLVMVAAWDAGGWRYVDGNTRDALDDWLDGIWWKLSLAELEAANEWLSRTWRTRKKKEQGGRYRSEH